jgi:hypothetical protein
VIHQYQLRLVSAGSRFDDVLLLVATSLADAVHLLESHRVNYTTLEGLYVASCKGNKRITRIFPGLQSCQPTSRYFHVVRTNTSTGAVRRYRARFNFILQAEDYMAEKVASYSARYRFHIEFSVTRERIGFIRFGTKVLAQRGLT